MPIMIFLKLPYEVLVTSRGCDRSRGSTIQEQMDPALTPRTGAHPCWREAFSPGWQNCRLSPFHMVTNVVTNAPAPLAGGW